ncbi:uncharacterized protein METZ01_LOCUS296528 [marine metagenome]|uniref:Uncharacterized protein n=1 Tax=marine metagenome TaxID=408172 RepID=A0A382M3S7_9ZZZZ
MRVAGQVGGQGVGEVFHLILETGGAATGAGPVYEYYLRHGGVPLVYFLVIY